MKTRQLIGITITAKSIALFAIMILLASAISAVPDDVYDQKNKIAGILLDKILKDDPSKVQDRLVKLDKVLDKLEHRGMDMSSHKSRIKRELETRGIPPAPEEEKELDTICSSVLDDPAFKFWRLWSSNKRDVFSDESEYGFKPYLKYNPGTQEIETYTRFACGSKDRTGRDKIEIKETWFNIEGKRGVTLALLLTKAVLDDVEFDMNYEWTARSLNPSAQILPLHSEGERLEEEHFTITGTDSDEFEITLEVYDDDFGDEKIATVVWRLVLRSDEGKDNTDFDKLLEQAFTYVARKELDKAQEKDDKMQLLVYEIANPGAAGAIKPALLPKEGRYREFRTKLVDLWIDTINGLVSDNKLADGQQKHNELVDKHNRFCKANEFGGGAAGGVAGWDAIGRQPCADKLDDLLRLFAAGELRLSGKVYDEEGKPVESAHIFLDVAAAAVVDTQPDGTYIIPALIAPGRHTLKAKKDGYYDSEVQAIEIKDNKITGNKILVLRKKGSGTAIIFGQLIDKDLNTPIASQNVNIHIMPDGRKNTAVDVLTDVSGKFQVELNSPSPPDGYMFMTNDLKTINPEYIEGESEAALVLAIGDTSKKVIIKAQSVTPDMSEIKVFVAGADGPLPIARVTVDASSVPGGANKVGDTDSNGVFATGKILPGKYYVFAEFAGYSKSVPIPLIVAEGETKQIEIKLNTISHLKGMIQGIVRDQQGNDVNVAIAEIALKKGSNSVTLNAGNTVVTNNQFTISNLELDADGSTAYILTVTKLGYLAGEKTIELTPTEVGDGTIILIKPGLAINGQVVKEIDGRKIPIDGVKLNITQIGTNVHIGQVTSNNGGLFVQDAGLGQGSSYVILLDGKTSAKEYTIIKGSEPIVVVPNLPSVTVEVVDADSLNGKIAFMVVNENDAPINAANILADQELTAASTTASRTAVTDETGQASVKGFKMPSDKPVKIRITHPAYGDYLTNVIFKDKTVENVKAKLDPVGEHFQKLKLSIDRLNTIVREMDSLGKEYVAKRKDSSIAEEKLTAIADVLEDIKEIKRLIRAYPPEGKAEADALADAITGYVIECSKTDWVWVRDGVDLWLFTLNIKPTMIEIIEEKDHLNCRLDKIRAKDSRPIEVIGGP